MWCIYMCSSQTDSNGDEALPPSTTETVCVWLVGGGWEGEGEEREGDRGEETEGEGAGLPDCCSTVHSGSSQ